MGRSKKTPKRDRLKQYEQLASKLRLAQTCCDMEMARDIVHSIMSLHRKFEREDCGPERGL